MGLWQDIMKFRLPIMIGAGGIVAYSAYQNARAGQAAAADAAAAGGGIAGAPAGLDPNQALAVQAAAFQAGGGLGLQGASLGLQTAQGGLDLAGIATMGAQALSGDVLGLATRLGEGLAGVAETAVGNLPSFAPYEGIQPQPTQPAPTAPAPTAPAAPAPTSPAAVASRSAEHMVRVSGRLYIYTVSSSGQIGNARLVNFGDGSHASVAPFSANNRTTWRTLTGSLAGWHYVPGSARSEAGGGNFSILRRYRETRADGSVSYTNWTTIVS